MADIVVASLHVYPLKGAGGMAPTTWTIEERGLRHDRRFMLVHLDGSFTSQREYPRLALLRAEVVDEVLHLSSTTETIPVPFGLDRGSSCTVRVWGDETIARHLSPDADRLASDVLGTPVRLVWMPENATRTTDASRGEPRRRIAFSDAAPILLVGSATLDELNRRLAAAGRAPVPMDRFRPNIVLSGSGPGEEDRWTRLDFCGLSARVSTACKRCQVVTIDQRTAERRGPEPLETLATYRKAGNSVVFGRYLMPDGSGAIEVGGPVVPSG